VGFEALVDEGRFGDRQGGATGLEYEHLLTIR